MTTQISHLEAEIRAFKEQVKNLEQMSRASSTRTPRLDTMTLDEVATGIIDNVVKQADFDIQKQGITQAITFFQHQISQRESKLAELREGARIAQLEKDYAEGLSKMEALQSKLDKKRAEIAELLVQIKECANNSKYQSACYEITGAQWWNSLSNANAAPALTQLSNKITWGIGLQSVEIKNDNQ